MLNSLINTSTFLFSNPKTSDSFSKMFPHYTFSPSRFQQYDKNRASTLDIMMKSFIIGSVTWALINFGMTRKYRIHSFMKLTSVSGLVGCGYALYHADRKIWNDYNEILMHDVAQLNNDNFDF